MNQAQLLATVCCSLFTRAAVYVSLVEHPARLECGTEVAVTEFAPSYRRAAAMQASLALLGCLAAVVAWLQGATVWQLVGGLLLFAVVPFTLLVIMPTNKALLAPSLDKRSARTAQLLSRWGRLHAVRSPVGLLAILVFLYVLTAG